VEVLGDIMMVVGESIWERRSLKLHETTRIQAPKQSKVNEDEISEDEENICLLNLKYMLEALRKIQASKPHSYLNSTKESFTGGEKNEAIPATTLHESRK